MLTSESLEERQLERELIQEVTSFDRYVDIGVTLVTVTSAKEGEPGAFQLSSGGLWVRGLRERTTGGIVDTAHAQPHICDPTENPVRWFCSEDQEPLILHSDLAPRGLLVIGSEGAGKTTAQAIWHYFRWLEHLGERREGGQTAPVLKRLGLVRQEVDKLWPSTWRHYVQRDDFEGYILCDGTRIRFQHTHRQSEAAGSPIQGFNWSWCGRDETQDQVDVHEDIENRGRAAKRGGTYYKQFCTATAKADPDWRALRDKLEASELNGHRLWQLSKLFGRRSPFVSTEFWDAKRHTMSPREYRRRVECEDVGPELATYPDFSRERNTIAAVDLGLDQTVVSLSGPKWRDVTKHELRNYGQNCTVLGGHDPGALWNVTEMLRAYVKDERRYARGLEQPIWVVIDEVSNEQSTVSVHIDSLLRRVREEYGVNLLDRNGRINPDGDQILIRADPADMVDKENAGTHKTVYTQFANAGIKIKPAAYNADNDGHGKVPKDPSIEVINTLILSAARTTRFYIMKRADGTLAAPRLAAALEKSERDYSGRADMQRKDKADVSHWPACVRYALWAIERPRLQRLAGRAGA